MTKTFLRTVLAGFAAAGVAGAQTPTRGPTPTSTPPAPAPVQQVTFKQVLPPAKPAEKLVAAVVAVADLVCPPEDSTLARPTDDAAMKAAVKAYTEARAEQVMKAVRGTASPDSWADHGGTGTLDFDAVGSSLVVRNSPAVVARVRECVASMRTLQNSQVVVEMVLVTVPSGNEAVTKLFGDKGHAALTADEWKSLLTGLKKEGCVDVLSQPKLVLMNKQAGFCQIGQQMPFVTAITSKVVDGKVAAIPQVDHHQVGLSTRMTPDVSADLKSIKLRMEVQHSECAKMTPLHPVTNFVTPVFEGGSQGKPIPFTQFLQQPVIDCQKVETTLVVPDRGTMAVKVGKRKTEQRIEHKVPVLGDLPYVNRLFRNVGVTMVETDTIAVVTVTRINTEAQERMPVAPPVAAWHPAPVPTMLPMPVAPVPQTVPWVSPTPVLPGRVLMMPSFPPKAVQPMPAPTPYAPTPVPATVPPLGVQRVNGSPLPPNAAPVPMPAPAPVAPPAMPQAVIQPSKLAARMTAPAGTTYQPLVLPPNAITVGPDGLERIGVDFSTVPASGSVPVTGTVQGSPSGETAGLMKAYQAACAAGRKDEASRLALQLLAKDPTCFGRDK